MHPKVIGVIKLETASCKFENVMYLGTVFVGISNEIFWLHSKFEGMKFEP